MPIGSAAGAALNWALRLPPASTRTEVTRDIAVRARDGVILRTDHYAPRLADAATVLIRTPYGRGGLNAVFARIIASHGFHVVAQACRGTGGSGGEFDPLLYERDDGLDTVDWLRRQYWFNGRLGTFGPSYVGYVQWAIADVPELAAMATMVTASDFGDPANAGESFALYTTLAWAVLMQSQGSAWLPSITELVRGQPKLARALNHLPLSEADVVATGVPVSFFRTWLEQTAARENGDNDYWVARGHAHRLSAVTAPVLMIGGWHDIFLPWQLRDYAALRAAGARPYLTIGGWAHGSTGLIKTSLREGIAWLATHLRPDAPPPTRQPVRLFVGGAQAWREFDDWPPAAGRTQPWFLHSGGGLAPARPGQPTTARFTYDPNDPTPSVGGALLVQSAAGPKDNRPLEARHDVLVYSSQPLREPVEIVGPVRARIHVRASRPFFDVFVRVCDAQPNGPSLNVCDALVRVAPGRYPATGDGWRAIDLDLWPAAYRFRSGHQIRVQVSAGAHPRYARNTGTGEPLSRAVTLQPVEIEIGQGGSRSSEVLLPLLP
jgi:putative CocE/NonD family hydrolase